MRVAGRPPRLNTCGKERRVYVGGRIGGDGDEGANRQAQGHAAGSDEADRMIVPIVKGHPGIPTPLVLTGTKDPREGGGGWQSQQKKVPNQERKEGTKTSERESHGIEEEERGDPPEPRASKRGSGRGGWTGQAHLLLP